MNRFAPGDRVRIDIPDETDSDYELYHGEAGTVAEVLTLVADVPGDVARVDTIYRVELDDGPIADFPWRDLRPPIDERRVEASSSRSQALQVTRD